MTNMDKIVLKHSDKVWIPQKLIKKALDEKFEATLAYFIILKKIHSKPIFYNFTYNSLSKQSGLSKAVLHRHLKVMLSEGLISIDNGNLKLLGSTSLRDKYKSNLIAVKTSNKKQQQVLNIQFTQIVRNLNHQQKIVNLKADIIKMHSSNSTGKKESKRLLNLQDKLNINVEKQITDYHLLSNIKFGELVNRKKSTGCAIQKRLNKAGLIISSKNTVQISSIRYNQRAFYNLCLDSTYRLSKNGYIFKVLPNRISIGAYSTY